MAEFPGDASPESKQKTPLTRDRSPRIHAKTRQTAGMAYDSASVTLRLEEAGSALLALPSHGHTTKLRSSCLDIVRDAVEAYGWTEKRLRPAMPSAASITRMDEALSWISLIPVEKYVLRRIVGARSLVHPISERHLFTWRRLGDLLGADHKAVQRWHANGIAILVEALNRVG